MSNEPQVIAKHNGLHLEVDCPYCGKTHLHGTNDTFRKQAPCLKGYYVIKAVFRREKK